MNDYKLWLKSTLQLMPETLVFHDGSLVDSDFPANNLVRIEQKSLWMFTHLESVTELIGNFQQKTATDVTFRLPSYGLTQFAKFEIADFVQRNSSAESVLWIDAGISRFVNGGSMSFLDRNVARLLQKDLDFIVEIDLHGNVNSQEARLIAPKIGSCSRVFSGASFWLRSSAIDSINSMVREMIEDWISRGIWDNEQVGLYYLLQGTSLRNRTHFIRQGNNLPGGVARQLLNSRLFYPTLFDFLLRFSLRD